MTDRPWTKGPWRATVDYMGFPVIVPQGSAGLEIASLSAADDDANARLIAAAPDLFEALDAMLRGAWSTYIKAEELEAARIALAKALGEQPNSEEK